MSSSNENSNRRPRNPTIDEREERDELRDAMSPRRDNCSPRSSNRSPSHHGRGRSKSMSDFSYSKYHSPYSRRRSPGYRSKYSWRPSRRVESSPESYRNHFSPDREERDRYRDSPSPRKDKRYEKKLRRRSRSSRSPRRCARRSRSSRRRSRSPMIYKWAHSKRRRSRSRNQSTLEPKPRTDYVGFRSDMLLPGAEVAGQPAPVRELWIPKDTLQHGPRWMGPPVLAPRLAPVIHSMPPFQGPFMPHRFRPPQFTLQPAIHNSGWSQPALYHWRT